MKGLWAKYMYICVHIDLVLFMCFFCSSLFLIVKEKENPPPKDEKGKGCINRS